MHTFVLLSLILIAAACTSRFHRAGRLKRWFKTLDLDKHQATFIALNKGINGFVLSRDARRLHDALEYTYGEIEFTSFIALMALTKPDINTVFYDLGSGVGKAVIATALVFDVKKSCGIERFETLHYAALVQKQRLQESDFAKAQRVHFIQADFLNTDFQDATLMFINATTFFGELWNVLNNKLTQVNPGTIVVSTGRAVHADFFLCLATRPVQMSWGRVNAYIQQRVNKSCDDH